MSRSLRGLLAATVAAAVALALAGGASAAPASTTFVIKGYEYAFTPTVGFFAGVGGGNAGDAAAWNVSVVHDPLGSPPPIYVDGGSLTLKTVGSTGSEQVTGTFANHGGTITAMDSGPNCTNQTYQVTGSLEDVATSTTSNGIGAFFAILTHYRVKLSGNCVTYAAKVSGIAVFSYS